ncbi:erythromycin esterase family protein [Paenibacillus anseongense]|uniref:erythromycin esterase family protein n=1 Tax=Paenibacillus anseongense TaxID=2682845 RepID=UPI002DBB9C08|nr:erythromycin esterase family protein [Paenibacillus anseongense]MEC0270446.1 erythromycin esterase family protein [Paenibacillus anseongense]
MDMEQQETLTWLQKRKYPLISVSQGVSFDDLAPFGKMVEGAKIVGLGESWHNMHEFLEGRYRLTRYLIASKNFRAVFFEGSLAASVELDEFVQGVSSSLKSINFGGLLNNQETVDFLEWLRAYNTDQSETEKAHIYGVDTHIFIMENAKKSSIIATQVFDYLHEVDPDYEIKDLSVIQDIFADVPIDNPRAAIAYFGTLEPSAATLIRTTFTEIADHLRKNADTFETRSSSAAHQLALQRSISIVQAHDIQCSMVQQSFEDSLDLRDRAIADNIQAKLGLLPASTKAVFLAQTVHIARATWQTAGSDMLIISSGELLAERYGSQYVALTTAYGAGTLASPHPLTQTLAIAPIRADSFDAMFSRLKENTVLLDLRMRGALKKPEWFKHSHMLETMDNLGGELEYTLPEALDLVLYVDTIQDQHSH